MNFEESYEHASLRKTVAQVCAGFGDDYLRRVIAEDGRTHELWSALGEAGLLGVNLPEEYGGGGAGIAELAIVVEEAAASGNPLLLLLVSAAISGEVLKDVGTDEQKARWLPAMADGSDKMVFAITEPDAGSNSHQISTKAVRDGDDWVLSGTKYYISGVDEASNLLVVARTGTSPSGRGEMTLFVVPTDDERLHRALIPVEVRAPEKQYTLTFDGVRVGDDRRVGEVGRGMDVVFRGLNPERITGAAIETGIARYALGKAAAYARERTVWGGTPIGAHQGVAHPLAAAAIDVELARLMTSRGRVAARQRPAGGGVVEHGEVRRGGRGPQGARRRDPGPRRQRPRHGVRPRPPVGDGAPPQGRPRQSRDGAELRRDPHPRSAPVLLTWASRPGR
ncbi:acyl-CoA dehydrogenase family protein [Nocardioides zeae]|uniref:Alkylation response protein AidB-like acyl-CoA dehydrogenase n=1 Tax=Nocardioides zeae TaxID=1457234 RepID=A0AAJ1U767_9ACTN|nr:alkylation response protein AidB-like acyl-CoA dehydrogenase [Nocardioides zeae]